MDVEAASESLDGGTNAVPGAGRGDLGAGQSSKRALLAVAAAGLSMFVALPPAASAASRTRCSSSLSTGSAVVGDRVALVGRVSPRRARPVRLQVRRQGRWSVIVRGRSSNSGKFRLKVPTGAPGKVKVRAYVTAAKQSRRVACRGRVLIVTTPIPYQPSPATSTRAVYAVASDQSIRPGEAAAIVADIDLVDEWFATQTIGHVQPRWVRNTTAAGSVGDPQVLTVRLAHTAAEYNAEGTTDDKMNMVWADLAAAAAAESESEQSAVWIDIGVGLPTCGNAAPHVLVALWEAACAGGYPSTSDVWGKSLGPYVLAHELTHLFGAAPACAPHSDGTGHVDDDPRDIIYNGPLPPHFDQLMLDPGHDDYYATGRTDCEDIALSPYWTRTSWPGS